MQRSKSRKVLPPNNSFDFTRAHCDTYIYFSRLLLIRFSFSTNFFRFFLFRNFFISLNSHFSLGLCILHFLFLRLAKIKEPKSDNRIKFFCLHSWLVYQKMNLCIFYTSSTGSTRKPTHLLEIHGWTENERDQKRFLCRHDSIFSVSSLPPSAFVYVCVASAALPRRNSIGTSDMERSINS